MTPVERLQAAIDKLEQFENVTTPGPWAPWTSITSDDEADRVYVTGNGSGPSEGNIVAEFLHEDRSDDVLTATLHRTIVAQLAILRFAVAGGYDLPEFLMLADAILGGDS